MAGVLTLIVDFPQLLQPLLTHSQDKEALTSYGAYLSWCGWVLIFVLLFPGVSLAQSTQGIAELEAHKKRLLELQ